MRKAHAAFILLALLVTSAGTNAAQQPRRDGAAGANQNYLNQAASAVLALKSTRFSIKREGAPAFLDEKTGITFTTADCSYAAPDRVSCNVKVSLKNGTILQLTRVWVPEGTFQTNPLTRQWAKVPPDANFNGALLFAKSGIADILRTSVEKLQSAGTQKIQDADTLHLKGDVSGRKLSPLVGSTIKPEATYPLDLWIDEKSFLPQQIHIAEPEGNGWLIELSGINEAVDIPTPQPPSSGSRP